MTVSTHQKYVFFDFDGTLVDTLGLAMSFGKEVGPDFNLKEISVEEFRKHSMREALKLMGLPIYRLPEFVIRIKKYLNFHIASVQLFEGTTELLKSLKDKGLHLVVLSSNSKENIEYVLQKNGVLNCFDEIISDSSILGKHKVLSRALKQLCIHAEQVVYVGDEVRDIEACQKVGVAIVAVDWGWDHKQRLEKAAYGGIAGSPQRLEAMILYR